MKPYGWEIFFLYAGALAAGLVLKKVAAGPSVSCNCGVKR